MNVSLFHCNVLIVLFICFISVCISQVSLVVQVQSLKTGCTAKKKEFTFRLVINLHMVSDKELKSSRLFYFNGTLRNGGGVESYLQVNILTQGSSF